ncbi:MAG TPA: hypothetical protein PKK48_08050, partial [Phycisphaerae bacterium]|nr:hypothetical protein [Phycisphaerae bacterium]
IVSWNVMTAKLRYFFRKEAVPWPASVKVSELEFRNISLPKQFGPYRMIEDDGILDRDENGNVVKDGKPDGEIYYREDILETLGIGSSLDEERVKERKSNWYVSRYYIDAREPENSPYKCWQLDLTFYTGSEVTVPHVPDICVLAGGASIVSRENLFITDVAGVPEPWDKRTPFTGLHYERNDNNAYSYVQYYLFSVNGLPETDRDAARIELTALSNRYVYYAKLQFFPRAVIRDKKQADERAKDFLRHCIPGVLENCHRGNISQA